MREKEKDSGEQKRVPIVFCFFLCSFLVFPLHRASLFDQIRRACNVMRARSVKTKKATRSAEKNKLKGEETFNMRSSIGSSLSSFQKAKKSIAHRRADGDDVRRRRERADRERDGVSRCCCGGAARSWRHCFVFFPSSRRRRRRSRRKEAKCESFVLLLLFLLLPFTSLFLSRPPLVVDQIR